MFQSNISNVAYFQKYIFLENWTHAVHGKCGKVQVWLVKVFTCNQVFHNKLLFKALWAFLYIFLFSWSTFRFYSMYLIMSKNVLKIFQTKKMKNSEIVYLKWRIESNCSWKRVLHFNKRAPLFDKRALGLSRRVAEGWILSNRKFWLTLLIQIKKKFFFSKCTLSLNALSF